MADLNDLKQLLVAADLDLSGIEMRSSARAARQLCRGRSSRSSLITCAR